MSQDKTSSAKAVVAASIGNALEWYDFSVFAFFATYIGSSFFVEGDETSALLNTFLVFAVGFIARPLGALLLGLYGDRIGRKSALTLTIALMAIGTFIIAVSPPVWMIGAGAPLLLLVGRLFQGFSAGGEIGGATAFLVESAPHDKRGRYAAWLQASMGISNILAALVGVVITSCFNDETIRQWAWRLPFLLGLVIIPIGWYIRKNVSETQDFVTLKAQAVHSQRVSLRLLIRDYPRHLLFGFMFSILWTVCVYVLIIYMPTYYASNKIGLGFTKNQAFLASFIGNLFMIVVCVMSGHLSDKWGVGKMLRMATVLLMIAPYPLLVCLQSIPTLPMLIVVHILFCIMVSLFSGVAPIALSIIFPVRIRSTGMAVAYNLAAIFFAGFTPAVMTWTTQYSVMAPAIYISLACLIALISIQFMFKLNKD